ncbi:SRPBCC family protein [Tautonia sociabilis]|uniref:SRPBCC family protein n=1 Tax=Tautonia sociabilis TaxID=2080755 RepID=A0A432MGE8_9BACT|nr:SRPBCC family protein [Tautonia sociabilis]RUL85722.1 SRPBCC family protein [Tautonia sociabilis]
MPLIFSTSRPIAAPPTCVFGTMTSPDAMRSWMPHPLRIEPRTGRPIGGLGSCWRKTQTICGWEGSEVFALTPGRMGATFRTRSGMGLDAMQRHREAAPASEAPAPSLFPTGSPRPAPGSTP